MSFYCRSYIFLNNLRAFPFFFRFPFLHFQKLKKWRLFATTKTSLYLRMSFKKKIKWIWNTNRKCWSKTRIKGDRVTKHHLHKLNVIRHENDIIKLYEMFGSLNRLIDSVLLASDFFFFFCFFPIFFLSSLACFSNEYSTIFKL